MAAKNGSKLIFGENHQLTILIPWGVKNFDEITQSRTVSEINAFLCFMQKFKMTAKMAGKIFLGKTRQSTLQISWG